MGVFAVILVCGIGGVLLLALWVVAGYEGLLRAHTRIEEAWARIQVQLNRRHDVIPGFLHIIRALAGHEADAIGQVDLVHKKAVECEDLDHKAEAEREVDQAMTRLMAIVERYPDVLNNDNFRQIQTELQSIESELAVARQHYNTQVAEYDAGISCIPTSVIARTFHFPQESYFELEYEAEQVDAEPGQQRLASVGSEDFS